MNIFKSIANGFRALIKFFKEALAELKKVRWPSRKELTSYSIIVFVTIILVTLYFWGLEFAIKPIIDQLLKA